MFEKKNKKKVLKMGREYQIITTEGCCVNYNDFKKLNYDFDEETLERLGIEMSFQHTYGNNGDARMIIFEKSKCKVILDMPCSDDSKLYGWAKTFFSIEMETLDIKQRRERSKKFMETLSFFTGIPENVKELLVSG